MYYELCPKHLGKIKPMRENVEYSIDELISREAACFADCSNIKLLIYTLTKEN